MLSSRSFTLLRAYFFLILLMCYLNETRPDTWRELGQTSSYEDFVRQRPVFKTIERELDSAGIEALVPLERPLTDGAASNDEVAEFVAQRSGRVLSAFTLLKSDFFSGLQKMSLTERVDGAPNFRRVTLGFNSGVQDGSKSAAEATAENGPLVYGTGMPTEHGLRKALEKMGAKEMTITWTGMREEPVIYVCVYLCISFHRTKLTSCVLIDSLPASRSSSPLFVSLRMLMLFILTTGTTSLRSTSRERHHDRSYYRNGRSDGS
jgi:hypothetical protein